jgi:hypothetical protein
MKGPANVPTALASFFAAKAGAVSGPVGHANDAVAATRSAIGFVSAGDSQMAGDIVSRMNAGPPLAQFAQFAEAPQ